MEWLSWSPWDFVICFCGLLDGAQRSNMIPIIVILLINKNVPLVNSVQWIGHFRVPNSHFQNEVKLACVVNGIFGLAAREMNWELNNERGQRGRGRKETLIFFPTPSPLFYSRHFSRGLWLPFLVLCSKTARKRLLRRLKLSAKPLW